MRYEVRFPKFRYKSYVANVETYVQLITKSFPLAYYDPDKHEIVMYYLTPSNSFHKAWTIFHELIHMLIPKVNLNYSFSIHLHTLHDFFNQMINGLMLRNKNWIYPYGDSNTKYDIRSITEGRAKGLRALYMRIFLDYITKPYRR